MKHTKLGTVSSFNKSIKFKIALPIFELIQSKSLKPLELHLDFCASVKTKIPTFRGRLIKLISLREAAADTQG